MDCCDGNEIDGQLYSQPVWMVLLRLNYQQLLDRVLVMTRLILPNLI